MRLGFIGVMVALGLSLSAVAEEAPEFSLVWSIDGGPYGSSRSLEPTMAVTPDTVYVSANVTREDRRYQVIRLFDARDGRPTAVLEHPDGAAFEGFGEGIAVNDRFLVTALHRKGGTHGTGAVLVFDTSTLRLRHRIDNPLGRDGAFFGLIPPVLHGDRVLASMTVGPDNLGRAWVFSADTGEVLLTLEEPDVPRPLLGKPTGNFFGRALAMNGTHIAVTANDRDGPDGLSARGIVFVFDARSGSLVHTLRSPDDGTTGFGQVLTMSEDRIFAYSLGKSEPLNWPTGQVHAFDLATGALQYTLTDPGVPESLEAFTAGKQGWGFPSSLGVDGRYLFSGLPDWSGSESRQGGLIVFDAEAGARLLTYGHQTGHGYGAFGQAIATGHGHVAVMQEIGSGAELARRVMLFRVTPP